MADDEKISPFLLSITSWQLDNLPMSRMLLIGTDLDFLVCSLMTIVFSCSCSNDYPTCPTGQTLTNRSAFPVRGCTGIVPRYASRYSPPVAWNALSNSNPEPFHSSLSVV